MRKKKHSINKGAGRRSKGKEEIENLFEIMEENFPHLVKEIDI